MGAAATQDPTSPPAAAAHALGVSRRRLLEIQAFVLVSTKGAAGTGVCQVGVYLGTKRSRHARTGNDSAKAVARGRPGLRGEVWSHALPRPRLLTGCQSCCTARRHRWSAFVFGGWEQPVAEALASSLGQVRGLALKTPGLEDWSSESHSSSGEDEECCSSREAEGCSASAWLCPNPAWQSLRALQWHCLGALPKVSIPAAAQLSELVCAPPEEYCLGTAMYIKQRC
jgi:hypothetical protein